MKTEKKIRIGGVWVAALPCKEHEFLMSPADVASGYGVKPNTLNQQKTRWPQDFVEGKHWVRTASGMRQPYPRILWTKRGIVRLGYCLQGKRCAVFRDAIEELRIDQPRSVSAKVAEKSPYKGALLKIEAALEELAEIKREREGVAQGRLNEPVYIYTAINAENFHTGRRSA